MIRFLIYFIEIGCLFLQTVVHPQFEQLVLPAKTSSSDKCSENIFRQKD